MNKSTATKVDAITLLKEDHKQVRRLLEELEETSDRASKHRRQLLSSIATLLLAHTTIEEEIFYPTFKQHAAGAEDRKLYFEAVEEHHVVDLVLEDLKKAEPGSPNFAGKAKVLKELVLHHVQEEEKMLLPRAKKLLDKELLMELGEEMSERKSELLKNGTPERNVA